MTLSSEEVDTFSRQLTLQGFGQRAQRRLKRAHVFITRVGGLGGPVAQWLAVAGVGRLTIAHGGELERPDMNRQILMEHARVGTSRAVQARDALRRLSPFVEITAIDKNVDEMDLDDALRDVDVCVDATPRFEERFRLNRACVARKLPMVEAAMDGFEGRVTTIIPGKTPCLACLYPEAPEDWDPSGFPVLGAVSGIAGAMAAAEVVKLLTGVGVPLAGRLLLFDAARMDFRQVRVRRLDACAVCGSSASAMLDEVA